MLAAVLATAALTLGLAGCVQREDTAESIANETVDVASLQDLTLRVGDQKGGTEALLRASGELEKLPFTIEFSTFTSGPPQIEAATAGKIDFAVTGNTPPIFGAAANAKVKIVTGYANNASGDAILIPGTSTLASVADLKGKKVAVAKGSSAHGHLLLQLNKVNLTLGPGKDVEPVFLQPADALSAFTSGNVDAWAIWDPYTAIVQLENNPKTLVTAEGVSNGYGFGIAGDEALADPRRNTAVRELRSGSRGPPTGPRPTRKSGPSSTPPRSGSTRGPARSPRAAAFDPRSHSTTASWRRSRSSPMPSPTPGNSRGRSISQSSSTTATTRPWHRCSARPNPSGARREHAHEPFPLVSADRR